MKKRTHYALSKQLLKDCPHDFSRLESLLFCFGSIFPDCTPLCLLHPHKMEVTAGKSKKRLHKILFEERNKFADSFRLGCLSHHLADYFTAPHNRTGVAGFCMDHRGYEARLHRVFKDQLKKKTSKEQLFQPEAVIAVPEDIDGWNFWKHIGIRHQAYKELTSKKESLHTDYQYIFGSVKQLFCLAAQKSV